MKAKKNRTKLLLMAVCLLSVTIYSCREEEEEVNANDYTCKTLPAFIANTGLDIGRSAFSTSEIRTMGLVLKEFPLPTSSNPPKTYQHPSWGAGGWLSPIQIDNYGNIYTASAPFINVLNNPVQKQNIIYKVNSLDAAMTTFMELPVPDSNNHRNPFGIVSMAFNCKKNILYVSSVAGSTVEKEKGCLYAIDVKEKKIVDRVNERDFFGIQLVVADGKLQLLAGSTRNSDMYAINIKSNGLFGSRPEKVASIEGLGLRGDDKVKKIIFKNENAIQVKGLEFNYNLIAPTEKKESLYEFYFDIDSKKWMLENDNTLK